MPNVSLLHKPELANKDHHVIEFRYPDLFATHYGFPTKEAAENAIALAQYVQNEQISLSNIKYE